MAVKRVWFDEPSAKKIANTVRSYERESQGGLPDAPSWPMTPMLRENSDMGIVRAGGSPAADLSQLDSTGGGGVKKLIDDDGLSGTLIEFTTSNQWVYTLQRSETDSTKWAWRRLPTPQPVINPTPYQHSGGLMLWVSRVGSVWVVRRPVFWPLIYRVQCTGSIGDGVPVTFENRAPFNSQVANIAQINAGAFPGNTQGTTIQINAPVTQYYRVSFDLTIRPSGDVFTYPGWSAAYLVPTSVNGNNIIKSEFQSRPILQPTVANPNPAGIDTQYDARFHNQTKPQHQHHGEDIWLLNKNDTMQLGGFAGMATHSVLYGWLTIEPLNRDLF